MSRILLVAAICLVLPNAVFAQSDVVLFGQGDTQTMYHWAVPWKKFLAQPKWAPASGNPPLSIAKATEVAEAWIRKKNPDVKAFSVSSVALSVSHTWQGEPEDRWYYKIEFQPIVSGQRLHGGQFMAVVLFDGTVVEPQQERGARPLVGPRRIRRRSTNILAANRQNAVPPRLTFPNCHVM